jgi:hypothetical protein
MAEKLRDLAFPPDGHKKEFGRPGTPERVFQSLQQSEALSPQARSTTKKQGSS